MGWSRVAILCGSLAFFSARLAFGQADPTFRSDVNFIQLSVIATDKQGKPVTDLSREEFQVLENGVPQDIRLFLATVTAARRT